MKKLVVAVFTSLSLAALPAYADPAHGKRPHSSHSPHSTHSHERQDDNSSLWAGVAIIGAIAGLALLAENNRQAQPAAAPVYAQPYPPEPMDYAPPQPPTSTWYYCPSSATYYPYARTCPEGWMSLPARPY